MHVHLIGDDPKRKKVRITESAIGSCQIADFAADYYVKGFGHGDENVSCVAPAEFGKLNC